MASKPITLDNHVFEIAYDRFGDASKPKCLILHGWGSSKELMEQAFEPYLGDCERLYLDLPGFGKSGNPTVLDTRGYTEIVKAFLETTGFMPDVVLGHSFGGKVATLLAPKHLVLIGSPGVPMQKSFKVRMKIKLSKIFKRFFGSALSRYLASSDVQGYSKNMYETFKNVVDEDFRPSYANFSGHALLFWGKADTASPVESAETIASLMPSSELFLYEGDHFFFLDKGGIIVETVLQRCGLKERS